MFREGNLQGSIGPGMGGDPEDGECHGCHGGVPLRDDGDDPGLPTVPPIPPPGRVRCLLLDASGDRERYGFVDMPYTPFPGLWFNPPCLGGERVQATSVDYDIETGITRVFLT